MRQLIETCDLCQAAKVSSPGASFTTKKFELAISAGGLVLVHYETDEELCPACAKLVADEARKAAIDTISKLRRG